VLSTEDQKAHLGGVGVSKVKGESTFRKGSYLMEVVLEGFVQPDPELGSMVGSRSKSGTLVSMVILCDSHAV